MKIVITSLSYLPSLGGLENFMAGLAEEWSKENEVTVFTKVENFDIKLCLPYNIVRKFSLFTLFVAVLKADIFIEANISLKTCIVGLLNYKKWHVTHQGGYVNHQAVTPFFSKGFIKNYLTYFSKNISCSNFVANSLLGNSIVIPNSYNHHVFRLHSVNRTSYSLVFLGRLVSDKGVDLLIQSLYFLNQKSEKFQLTIIGIGPEEKNLVNQVESLGLQEIVFFKGVLTGPALALELNKSEVMVIPSRWKEPFGIVALEGLACGCKIVCPDQGGLKEAAGESAYLYLHNDLDSLIDAIHNASNSLSINYYDFKIQCHLDEHTQENIAQQYLFYFKSNLYKK
jgi:glycogen(starch) synthase